MNYVVDKVKGGVKRGCVHFDTPSFTWQNNGFWHAKGCFLQSYSSARFMRAANWKSAGTRMQNEKSSPKYIERSLPWK